VTVGLPSDPGVQVAPGDPGQLAAAAGWHSDLADGLDSHAATIDGTAGSLAAAWQGDAANSYQALSGMISAHFRATAGTSRAAAASLRRYGTELERCQREGMRALSEAEHWLAKARVDQAKLTAAQNAVTAAQTALTTAQGEANAAANVVGHAAAGLAAAAATRVRAAQDSLTRVQADAGNAQQALTEDETQLASWQARGHQAWKEALQAAETATGSLDPLCVAPPPFAGAPSPFVGGPSAGALPGSDFPFVPLLTGGGYATSALGGAKSGISGLASWAGRTLRTGETAAARSAAAPVLRGAGGLAKELGPYARAAGPLGVVVGVGAGIAGGESPPDAALHAGMSTGGAVLGAGVVGGVCEAGTLGLGSVGCGVLGAGAAGVGSWLGNKGADLVDTVIGLI
jgi:hypothetical protein